jgi:hypothetical protein
MIGASLLWFSSDWSNQPVLPTRQLPDLPIDKTYPQNWTLPLGVESMFRSEVHYGSKTEFQC